MKKDARTVATHRRVKVISDEDRQIILRPDSKHFFRTVPVEIADLHSIDDLIVESRSCVINTFSKFIEFCKRKPGTNINVAESEGQWKKSSGSFAVAFVFCGSVS